MTKFNIKLTQEDVRKLSCSDIQEVTSLKDSQAWDFISKAWSGDLTGINSLKHNQKLVLLAILKKDRTNIKSIQNNANSIKGITFTKSDAMSLSTNDIKKVTALNSDKAYNFVSKAWNGDLTKINSLEHNQKVQLMSTIKSVISKNKIKHFVC